MNTNDDSVPDSPNLDGTASPGQDTNGATLPKGPADLASAELTPELLEWARNLYSEEEILAGLNEIRETGGLQFCDFIEELEQAAGLRP